MSHNESVCIVRVSNDPPWQPLAVVVWWCCCAIRMQAAPFCRVMTRQPSEHLAILNFDGRAGPTVASRRALLAMDQEASQPCAPGHATRGPRASAKSRGSATESRWCTEHPRMRSVLTLKRLADWLWRLWAATGQHLLVAKIGRLFWRRRGGVASALYEAVG